MQSASGRGQATFLTRSSTAHSGQLISDGKVRVATDIDDCTGMYYFYNDELIRVRSSTSESVHEESGTLAKHSSCSDHSGKRRLETARADAHQAAGLDGDMRQMQHAFNVKNHPGSKSYMRGV